MSRFMGFLSPYCAESLARARATIRHRRATGADPDQVRAAIMWARAVVDTGELLAAIARREGTDGETILLRRRREREAFIARGLPLPAWFAESAPDLKREGGD